MNIFASADNLLNLVRQETDVIGVPLSFGKDSLAVLQLCAEKFSRVEAFYLFRVRGLEIVKTWSDWVKDRFGVEVQMYPHFDLVRCYRNAVLQPHWLAKNDVPNVKMKDVENYFRAQRRVSWLAFGWRRNDSFSRALIMKKCAGFDPAAKRVFPLRCWKRRNVLDFLAEKKIPIPPGFGRKEQGGLDFHPEALRELRDKYPNDYCLWLRDFPFSEIQLLDNERVVD